MLRVSPTALAMTTALVALTTPALAGRIEKAPFGVTRDGQQVDLYTLTNDHGMVVRFMAYGGAITEIDVPDRTGQSANVVLGCRSLQDYERAPFHFGALIGRYANRIGNARLVLDGKEYRLPANNRQNTLHGGPNGLDKAVWQVQMHEGGGDVGATLSHTSPDGDENFPGALNVHLTYTLTNANELRIDYEATTDRDTVLNLTNHSYFNLRGNGSSPVFDQLLQVAADLYTPVDEAMIPTSELAPVAGTPFDFRNPVPLGARITSPHPQMVVAHGYDHNFVLNKPQFPTTELKPGQTFTSTTVFRFVTDVAEQSGH